MGTLCGTEGPDGRHAQLRRVGAVEGSAKAFWLYSGRGGCGRPQSDRGCEIDTVRKDNEYADRLRDLRSRVSISEMGPLVSAARPAKFFSMEDHHESSRNTRNRQSC